MRDTREVYNPQTVSPHADVNADTQASEAATPPRLLGLRSAVSLNVMNMIGVGPFITLPLVVASLGSGAWLGWLLGAALALCDGLVWAELGAALPASGGSYTFLREIYRPAGESSRFDLGRFLGFLYVWQMLFTAPLSVASGALGLAQYAAFLWPPLAGFLSIGPVHVRVASLLAAAVCGLVVMLLSRGLGGVMQAATVLSLGVLGTMAWVIATGLLHLRGPLVAAEFHLPHGPGLLMGVGAATLITTYDYWGYYNVCFLGGEVRAPGRTIPRAVLLSIALVTVLYLGMNFAVLGAVPIAHLLGPGGRAQPMAAVLMQSTLHGVTATVASRAVAVLIIWTAFSSVAALLLGYSRAPYAAAREGNFFAPFARVHPRLGFPQTSLLVLGGMAALFCFFDLRTVIVSLVAVRIVLQYGVQQIGVMVLRVRRPTLPRPFRMWLYPLPPLLALTGFAFLLLERKGAMRELGFAAALGLSGALLYAWRSRRAVSESV